MDDPIHTRDPVQHSREVAGISGKIGDFEPFGSQDGPDAGAKHASRSGQSDYRWRHVTLSPL
jgi:hypothetical protein